MSDCLLGIDIGTTNIKAVVFTADGTELCQSNYEHSTLHPYAGWAEQDSSTWWSGTRKVLQDISQNGSLVRNIKGIGITSQAPALVPLDAAGQPLRNALIWMDTRSAPQCRIIREVFGEERIREITGNRTDASYILSKILWFKENEPELFRKTAQILNVNSYIAHKLGCGYYIDLSHASLSQMFDVRTQKWSGEITDFFEIPRSLLPKIYEPTAVVGQVSTEASRATGLPAGIPIVAGIVDANAAALAVGIVGKGDGALIMGTSSVLIMGMDSWAECGNLAEIYHVSTQKTVVYGPMSATGASLKWIRDQFTQKSGLDGDEDLYRQLTGEAAQIAPGADGLIFLPYMMGERAPLWDPYAQGTLFGLSLATTRGHMVRAIMEGAAFAIHDNYQEAQRLGLQLNRLMAVGGGNNEFWLKIIASVLNVPISQPVRSNGTVFGAALLAGAGTGLYPELEKTVRELLSLRKTIEPDPRWHAHYQKVFAIYKDLYAQLKNNMHRLAATKFRVVTTE